MRIENHNLSPGTSACLKTFADLASANLQLNLDVTTKPAGVKGELISSIIVAIGIGLVTNAIYDLLKLAVQQHLAYLSDDDFVTINNVKVLLKSLLSDPALRKAFDEQESTS